MGSLRYLSMRTELRRKKSYLCRYACLGKVKFADQIRTMWIRELGLRDRYPDLEQRDV